MQLINIEHIDKMTSNRYEAVIVAAQHARRLNQKRLNALATLQEGGFASLEARKITMVALKDLIEGRVKFERSDSM